MAAGKKATKRTYKKNYCAFCEQQFYKLARHIRAMHQDDVEEAAAVKVGGEVEKQKMSQLLAKGNSRHNFAVLRGQSDGAIVPEKLTKFNAATVPCEFCEKFFSAKYINKHFKNCKSALGKTSTLADSCRLKVSAETISKELATLLATMRENETSKIVRTDSVIILLGNAMAKKWTFGTPT